MPVGEAGAGVHATAEQALGLMQILLLHQDAGRDGAGLEAHLLQVGHRLSHQHLTSGDIKRTKKKTKQTNQPG